MGKQTSGEVRSSRLDVRSSRSSGSIQPEVGYSSPGLREKSRLDHLPVRVNSVKMIFKVPRLHGVTYQKDVDRKGHPSDVGWRRRRGRSRESEKQRPRTQRKDFTDPLREDFNLDLVGIHVTKTSYFIQGKLEITTLY